MFKWFSKLNIYQKLSAVSIFVAVLCFLVLIGVFAFRNSIDSEFGKPLVGLLNGQRQSKEEEANKTVEVVLDKTEAALEIGKNLQLVAKIEGAEGANTILWDSSDDKIAKVDEKGIVTPIAVGTVTIRARMNDRKSAVCVVKISEAPKPPVVVETPKPAPVVQTPVVFDLQNYPCSTKSNDYEKIVEAELFRLVNQYRKDSGVLQLKSIEKLSCFSQIRAIEETVDQPNHARPATPNDDMSFATVFDPVIYGDVLAKAENIISGTNYDGISATTLAITMFDAWSKSSDHRNNMLSRAYNETGFSVNIVRNSDGLKYYAVQLFAQK